MVVLDRRVGVVFIQCTAQTYQNKLAANGEYVFGSEIAETLNHFCSIGKRLSKKTFLLFFEIVLSKIYAFK